MFIESESGGIEPKFIVNSFKFLSRNWNSIVAFVAIFGFLAYRLLPEPRLSTTEFFLFLGANAIIWTLIEVKRSLNKNKRSDRFRSMRIARGDIIQSIRKALKRSRKRQTTILIIGGRIRTISDMLSEVIDDLRSGELSIPNVTFDIYCLNPTIMKSWDFEKLTNRDAFFERMKIQSDDVISSTLSLKQLNNSEPFRSRNISFNINHYDLYPLIFAFLIGGEEIYWGYYTWNLENEDFDGPVNPCYRITKASESFNDFREWITNYANFLLFSKGSRSNTLPQRDSTQNYQLNQILRINQTAYDIAAETYKVTGPARIEKMELVLQPLFELLKNKFDEADILEIGPGEGRLTHVLTEEGYNVTAIDISPAMVNNVRGIAPKATTISGDFLSFDFEGKMFSCIIAIAFIHLFPSAYTLNILNKIRKLLTPNGIAFISTTIHDISEEGFYEKDGQDSKPLRYRKRFTVQELESLLKSSGFSIIKYYENEDGSLKGKKWMNFIIERAKIL